MRLKIIFVLKYWLLWILFSECWRFIFLMYNYKASTASQLTSWLYTFIAGLRMDMAIAAYVTAPIILILIIGELLKNSLLIIIQIYTVSIFCILTLLQFIDLFLYEAWGIRLDATPLKYLENPAEVAASVGNLPIFWIVFFYLLIVYFFSKRIIAFIKSQFLKIDFTSTKFYLLGIYLLLIGVLIIPARGGIQQIPLNQSSVYFSTNNFLNQASLNVGWNFIQSLVTKNAVTKNDFIIEDDATAKVLKDSLFNNKVQVEYLIDTAKKPNIILIVWESFTEKATHISVDGIEVTPRFNQLKKEGVYFSNIYASGDRTDKGIVAILSGYPAQPTTSIIKSPQKVSKLPSLGNSLKAAGYNNHFYYGGELEFANLKSYVLSSGYDHLISKNDFDENDQNSKWGAHDGVVKNKIIKDMASTSSPFFCTWLTLSSHEPFETPNDAVIKGNSDEKKFLNSLHYTDEVISEFIIYCKSKPWWNNTLIVISADHGHRTPITGKKVDDFKVPLLLLGGALKRQSLIKNIVGSQTDIATTVLAQVKLNKNDFSWGKNLLDSSAQQWAYFCFNNGFGFVQPNNYFINDNIGKIIIEKNGILTDRDFRAGKVLQQLTFQDYLDK